MGIVCLMTLKPGWIGALAIMVVALIAAAIVSHVPLGTPRTALSTEQRSSVEPAAQETGIK